MAKINQLLIELVYMKDTDKQKKFIELRAKNWSFQKISQEIGVSKTTLIKWSKEFDYEITNLHNLEMEALLEDYQATREQRIEYLGKLQDKILTELDKRDLSTVNTDKLLDMLLKTSTKLEALQPERTPIFRTPEDIKERRKSDKYTLELLPSFS